MERGRSVSAPNQTGASHEGYSARPDIGPICPHRARPSTAARHRWLARASAEFRSRDDARMAAAQPRARRIGAARRPHAARYRRDARRCLAGDQQTVLEVVMSVIATGFERAAARSVSRTQAARHALRWLLAARGGLVPPPDGPRRDDAELLRKCLKYPPI